MTRGRNRLRPSERKVVFTAFVLSALFFLASAGGCGSGEDEEHLGKQSQALDAATSDGGCREVTLQASRSRHEHGHEHGHEHRRERGHGHGHDDCQGDDERELSPPMRVVIPAEIALSGTTNNGAHRVTLTFDLASGGDVECEYKGGAGHPNDRALLVSCSHGRHAGDIVRAEEVSLELEDNTVATARVTLSEAAPCGPDASTDASVPADTGTGVDTGVDTGAGVDASPACTPATCVATGACMTATCTPSGCQQTPLPAGTACSDGSACTAFDACDGAGHCSGLSVTLPPSTTCLESACDPLLGIVQIPALDGTTCVVDACTVGSTCIAGSCAGGAPRDCSSGQVCVTDSCDVVQGCVHTPKPAGDTSCSNLDPCDGLEVCSGAGTCVPGVSPTLDDGNPCTLDACSVASGVTHVPVASCDPTPVQSDGLPFESRASIFGRLLSTAGGAITGATFTVYDERAGGTPRGDVLSTNAPDGSFKLKLSAFPESEPERTPPHRVIVVIDSPGTIRAYREGYAHPGDTIDLGDVRLLARDPRITNIGPAGGTATDSQGLVEVVIPPGALATTVPVQITPIRQRSDFPAPLPSSTLTMYGFELEPSGTTFATPATVRLANYRNVPTTLAIPTGSYDPIENRWEHEGTATWDGARFAAQVTHFSTWDGNPGQAGDLVLQISSESNANASAAKCSVGSSWRAGGGSVEQAFALPSARVRGEDLAFSLHYASGLAGSRKLGAPPETSASPSTVPRGTLAVSVPGVKIHAQCMPRGGAEGGATAPGVCTAVVGSCGLGGGAASSMRGSIQMLASTLADVRALAAQAKEAEFDGWVEMPLTSPSQMVETGLVTQRVTVESNAVSACAMSGGVFGVSDPLAPRVQLSGVESGAYLAATRKVLVHHRFTSPYGAGWAVREVSRLYTDGDVAKLVSGDGEEEDFRPRARVTPAPELVQETALARDPVTGELFAAAAPGRIARLDPATGVLTDLVSGLAFSSTSLHSLAIAYVGGARHFVVATGTALLDIDGAGTQRTLAIRTNVGNSIHNQAAVAALDDVVFYTDGSDTSPLLYRVRLSLAAPGLEQLSAASGDVRLQPHLSLGSVKFDSPRGLAVLPNRSLLVADPRRHVVYSVDPDASGAIGAASHVRQVLGMGTGTYLPAVGERQPALAYSMNQPSRLAVGEDGIVLVMTSYGVTAFDPVAKEAELLFIDAGRDEIVPSLGGLSGAIPASPASFVALTGTSMYSRTSSHGLVRVDVERLASTREPTRTVRRLPGVNAGYELTDTTAAAVWRFDAIGRMVEQRKRTGETDFTVEYVDARLGRVARIIDAVGGVRVFTYDGVKLASIRDPGGRVTMLTVDARGDLVRIVEPDGEAHVFTYEAHRMVTKTSPRGDVTSYTYATDGTLATSLKPGGEAYSFEAAYAAPPSTDAAGLSVRKGAFTDARGVRHTFTTDIFGRIDEETVTADGETRTVLAVHPATLASVDEPSASARKNVFLRTSHHTLNGVAMSAGLVFDSSGRAVRQRLGTQIGVSRNDQHRWDYAANGWLLEAFSGPSNTAQRIERDPAGHVVRIFDVEPLTGGSFPTGREIRFTWRADGQPATMTEHGVTTTFTYDDAGSHNLVGSVDTLGRTLTLAYDANGNLISTSDGTASASFVFDAQNRLRTSRDALGNETTFRYEQVGCGCSEQDEVTGVHTPDLPAGVEWTMAYGPQGRLASVTDPQGFTESYTYEPTGEVRTVKDRLDRTTTMAHDQLGRLLAMVDTLGRSHSRSYSVPTAGAWTGPTLTRASADATTATASLSTPLRDGDYQLGVNALQPDGMPARISLYRDATFALAFTHTFDEAQRLMSRTDRASLPIDSTATLGGAASYWHELRGYDANTSAPVLTSFQSNNTTRTETTVLPRNAEFDVTSASGFAPSNDAATYAYTRDAGGRLIAESHKLTSSGLAGDPTAPQFNSSTFGLSYTYGPDGRVRHIGSADGGHAHIGSVAPNPPITTLTPGSRDFTYDARGLVATQTDFGGTYRYGYDAVGRNTRLEFPDGHVRVQVYDDLGRITSRCYEYPADPALTRCYGAAYDPVGNPLRLSDPEGADIYEYDALDRLKKVTRVDGGGLTVAVEDYAFNALGALTTHAGLAVDHRRPRLGGGGSADAAVPATHDAQPVTLDLGGRVTAMSGLDLTWSRNGELRRVSPPVPSAPAHFGFDAMGRRAWALGPAAIDSSADLYLYEGANRIAALQVSSFYPDGVPQMSFLYDGVDHPLRVAAYEFHYSPPTVFVEPTTFAYYELDLAGNVRRLRRSGGEDLGGYRYSAFGRSLEDTVQNYQPNLFVWNIDLRKQPLRWKGMWRYAVGGTELYDARARFWSPALGTFLSVDEFVFHDPNGTLWSWPHQNPVRFRDPSGRMPEDRWPGMAPDEIAAEQSGQGMAAATFLTAAAAAPFVSVEVGVSLWGALSEMGPAGTLITALLGGPAAAQLPNALSQPVALPGQLTGDAAGAGQCVEKMKQSIGTFGGKPVLAPTWNHWANQLPSGMMHDPTLRANLVSRGAYVGDIAFGQSMFTAAEWASLVARGGP